MTNRRWVIIDAKDIPLGRLASKLSILLMGKYQRDYKAHVDSGDYVIVINAAKIYYSGQKLAQKHYYSHSGYPGAIKSMSLGQLLEKDASEVLKKAVKGMLPRNKLLDARLKRLRISLDDTHKYQAHKPIKEDVNG